MSSDFKFDSVSIPEDYCRICLTKTEASISIFEVDSCAEILRKIDFVAGVHISENDSQPSRICLNCLYLLDSAYTFKNLCIQSDSFCKQILYQDLKVIIKKRNFLNKLAKLKAMNITKRITVQQFPLGKWDKKLSSRRKDSKRSNSSRCYTDFPNLPTVKEEAEVSLESENIKNESQQFDQWDDCGFDNDYNEVYEDASLDAYQEGKKKEKIQKRKFNALPRKKYERTPVCKKCDIVFDTKENYELHKKEKHNEQKLQVCDVCGIVLPLKLCTPHRLKHFPKGFICDVCGKSYYIKSQLKLHIMITHLGKSPYMCKICGQPSRYSSHLKVHMEHKHSQSCDYLCNVCNGRYKSRHALRIHLTKQHYGGMRKDYTCKLCGKTSNRRYRIDEHMRDAHNLELKGDRNPEQLQIVSHALSQDARVSIEAALKRAKLVNENKPEQPPPVEETESRVAAEYVENEIRKRELEKFWGLNLIGGPVMPVPERPQDHNLMVLYPGLPNT